MIINRKLNHQAYQSFQIANNLNYFYRNWKKLIFIQVIKKLNKDSKEQKKMECEMEKVSFIT